MTLKLQKSAPIVLVGGSQEPSPTVHAPAKPKAPMRPDSVPSQYDFSLHSKSTIYSSFPAFRCGAISAFISVFLASVGTSAAVFTQHSNDFLGFVALMSPVKTKTALSMQQVKDHVCPGLARRVPTICVLLSTLFQERVSYFTVYMLLL